MKHPAGQTDASMPAHRSILPRRRRDIVVAIDDTGDSENSLMWMLDTMYMPGDMVHLVHVIAPQPETLHNWNIANNNEETEILDTKTFAKRRFARVLEENKIQFSLHVVSADSSDSQCIAKTIQDKANELGAAAIVIGKHSKSKITQFFLGSVTKCLITNASRDSAIPVCIVPPPQDSRTEHGHTE